MGGFAPVFCALACIKKTAQVFTCKSIYYLLVLKVEDAAKRGRALPVVFWRAAFYCATPSILVS
jgi:hypothetical protein